MARYIFCKSCSDKSEKAAMKFDEVYVAMEGTPINSMVCDSCNAPLERNQPAFAAMLLDSPEHPNYPGQHPSVWAKDYLIMSKLEILA